MNLPKNMKLLSLGIPAFATALLFTGCSGEDPKVAPPKDEIQSAVKLGLPPYVSLAEIETETIPVSEDHVKINFKAKIKASENLYEGGIHFEDADDIGSFRTLKILQTGGAEKVVYGSLLAKRTMDKWDTTDPEFNSGLSELGRPRGAFEAEAVVEGSDAFRQKLKEIKDERAEVARKEEEGKRKIEEDRLAKIAAEKAMIDARREELLALVTVGKRYEGTVALNNSNAKGRVELVFTKLSGFLIEAELSNPDDVSQKCIFSGELILDTDQNKNRSEHNFVLSQKFKQEMNREIFSIYWGNSVISLSPSEDGLFGKITDENGYWYVTRLQPKP